MTREEYNEFRNIRKTINEFIRHGAYPGPECTFTIRTNASADYKHRLDTLYTSLNFHPASVRVDTQYFDKNERIIYIYGRTWDLNGEKRPWTELYTMEEKERFAMALE